MRLAIAQQVVESAFRRTCRGRRIASDKAAASPPELQRRRKQVAPLCALLACMCAMTVSAAQTRVAPQAPPRDTPVPAAVPTGTGGISGIVRDEVGRPLRRVTVAISGDMRLQRAAMTDDEGRFAFADLPPGRFTVTASKPGYPSASYGAIRPNRPGAGVFLDDAEQVSDLAITLARGGVITGTVFDAQGQPMPGVPVQPWEVRTALSGERIIDSPSTGGVATTADDRGQFRFYGLPPGEYTVGTSWFYSGFAGNVRVPTDAEIQAAFQAAASPTTAGPSRAAASALAAAPTYNYAQVFHPGTVDPLTAGTVQLKAGEERSGVDLHMQFRPMSHLIVLVTGPEGSVAGARLTVARTGKVAALNTTSVSGVPPSGRYESQSLGPGEYRVMVQAQPTAGRPALSAAREVTLDGAEPITVSLDLQPGMTASGRVVFEGTSPPPPFSSVRVGLQGMSPGTWATLPNVSPDANGVFAQDGVFPASFRLAASIIGAAPNVWTLKSVTMSDRDVTDLPVEIRAGDTPSFVVTFSDQPSELSGSLVDPAGRPSTDYFVVVVSADRAHWLPLSRRIASTRPDGRGRFVFRGLPPGDYRLAATTDLVARDLQEVSALEALLPQSLPVTLGLGERKAIDIRVAGRD